MNKEALIQQFLAIRAMCDAALAQLGDGEVCAHPVAHREVLGGFGSESWACRDCGFEFKEVPDEEAQA